MNITQADAIIAPLQLGGKVVVNFALPINRNNYENLINANVTNTPGIYIWVNKEKNEIIYIGMAGKINYPLNLGNQGLNRRLKAPRDKYKSTLDYLNALPGNNINKLEFNIYYLNALFNPPTYVEAILLNEFIRLNQALPILNKSF